MSKKTDLGLWSGPDGNVKVWIVDYYLVAVFENGGACPHGGTRGHFLIGTLEGDAFPLKLSGTTQLCTRQKELIDDCNEESVWETTFDATVEKHRIYGVLHREWFERDDEGKLICSPEPRDEYFRLVSHNRPMSPLEELAEKERVAKNRAKRFKEDVEDAYEKAQETFWDAFWDPFRNRH